VKNYWIFFFFFIIISNLNGTCCNTFSAALTLDLLISILCVFELIVKICDRQSKSGPNEMIAATIRTTGLLIFEADVSCKVVPKKLYIWTEQF